MSEYINKIQVKKLDGTEVDFILGKVPYTDNEVVNEGIAELYVHLCDKTLSILCGASFIRRLIFGYPGHPRIYFTLYNGSEYTIDFANERNEKLLIHKVEIGEDTIYIIPRFYDYLGAYNGISGKVALINHAPFNFTQIAGFSPSITAYLTAKNTTQEVADNIQGNIIEQERIATATRNLLLDIAGGEIPDIVISSETKWGLKLNSYKSLSGVSIGVHLANGGRILLFLDCGNYKDISSLFEDNRKYESRRNYEFIGLWKAYPTGEGMKKAFYHLRKLKEVSFSASDLSLLTTLDYTFADTSYKMFDSDMYSINLASVASYCFTFACAENLKKISFNNAKTSNKVTDNIPIDGFCAGCKNIDFINFRTDSFSNYRKVRSAKYAFLFCEKLEAIYIGFDFIECENITGIFHGCTNLQRISNIKNINRNFSLQDSPKLTTTCIDALYDLTEDGATTDFIPQTLTFHPNVGEKLTDNYIAGAVYKGWNIAY